MMGWYDSLCLLRAFDEFTKAKPQNDDVKNKNIKKAAREQWGRKH